MKELNTETVTTNETVWDYEARICLLCGTEFQVGIPSTSGEEIIVSPCSCCECAEEDIEDIEDIEDDKIEDACEE